jgi:hypothetical protein
MNELLGRDRVHDDVIPVEELRRQVAAMCHQTPPIVGQRRAGELREGSRVQGWRNNENGNLGPLPEGSLGFCHPRTRLVPTRPGARHGLEATLAEPGRPTVPSEEIVADDDRVHLAPTRGPVHGRHTSRSPHRLAGL